MAAAILDVDSAEGKQEGWVDGSRVEAGGGRCLGKFTRVASHFLHLLLASLSVSSAIAQHTSPGVLEGASERGNKGPQT